MSTEGCLVNVACGQPSTVRALLLYCNIQKPNTEQKKQFVHQIAFKTQCSPVYALLIFLKAHGTQILYCQDIHVRTCHTLKAAHLSFHVKVRQRRGCSRKWDINKQQWHTSSITSSHQSSADTSASHALRVLLMSEATGTSVWNICSGYPFLQNEPLF